jgi:hypothetical protein
MPRQQTKFTPIHMIFIPLVHEGSRLHALDIACFSDAEITLVGLVVGPPEQSLSTGAGAARACNGIMFFREELVSNPRINSSLGGSPNTI